jgi:hypothetical protein
MNAGFALEDLSALAAKIKATSFDDVLRYLGGKQTMGQVIPEVGKTLNAVTFGQAPKTVGRFAGSALGRGFARAVPALSAVSNVADVADVIAGDDGLGNKAADVVGMGVGGTIGAFMGGPLGASVGASTGKAVMDGIQGMFFSKPTKEEKLAEALALLQGGRV